MYIRRKYSQGNKKCANKCVTNRVCMNALVPSGLSALKPLALIYRSRRGNPFAL